ncbi:MAG TPA: hypothetical protein VNY29_10650 [Terriglobales bacterium]|nr:hypothetical protein [Terriglobales bacterium]
MKAWEAGCPALALGLMLLVGCGHQSAVPTAVSSGPARAEEHLPFEREGQSGGISPTSAVIPPGAHVPSGTPVTVHLQATLSSATAHSGDPFDAVLDEPIVVNGQVLAERGAPVTGRIMEARAAELAESAGYLRLTLHSISLRGQSSLAQSSSTFVKGVSPRKRNVTLAGNQPGRGTLMGASVPGSHGYPIGGASPTEGKNGDELTTGMTDVTVGPERRLTFRLTEPIPLHE